MEMLSLWDHNRLLREIERIINLNHQIILILMNNKLVIEETVLWFIKVLINYIIDHYNQEIINLKYMIRVFNQLNQLKNKKLNWKENWKINKEEKY